MFLSSLLKCVPLRFGLLPYFLVIQKKAVKDPVTADMKRKISKGKRLMLNETAIDNVRCVTRSTSVYCCCILLIFLDNQPNVNGMS